MTLNWNQIDCTPIATLYGGRVKAQALAVVISVCHLTVRRPLDSIDREGKIVVCGNLASYHAT